MCCFTHISSNKYTSLRAQVYSIWKPVRVLSVKNMQFSVALSREIYKDKGRINVCKLRLKKTLVRQKYAKQTLMPV